MVIINWKKWSCPFLLTLATITLFSTLFLTYRHFQNRSKLVQNSKSHIQNEIKEKIKDEIFGNRAKEFNQNILLIVTGIILTILFSSLFLVFFFNSSKTIIWTCSIAATLSFLIGIITIWNTVLKKDIFEKEKHTVIVGKTSLNKFIKIQEIEIQKPLHIPTGIFIRYIDLPDISSIKLNGTIWQKYPKDMPKDISKEFFFPKSIKSEIKQSYILKESNSTVIGWDFNCTIPQKPKYSKYPFDSKILNLRIRHKDLSQNIVLTPDFDSYTLINPESLPGVMPNLETKGWNIKKSFFSYKIPNRKTNFGINESKSKKRPQLHFNILLKRKFLPPFISHILRLLVALLTLFIIFLTLPKKWFFSAMSTVSAILFALILAHSSLRNSYPTPEFFYLEYFYLLSYFIIIMVVIDFSLYFKTIIQSKFLRYENNIIPKALYWPVMLGLLFAVTVYTFY